MNDKEANEYYREDASSNCRILNVPCATGRDCRICGFAREQFKLDLQIKNSFFKTPQLPNVPDDVHDALENQFKDDASKVKKGRKK